MLGSLSLPLLLDYVWEWLREGRDSRGLERLDEAMEQAINPMAFREQRLQDNLQALGRSKQVVYNPDEPVTDEAWEELLDANGMAGIPLEDDD